MLSGRHRKFAEGIVRGLTATDAYAAAYPKSSPANANKNAPRLVRNAEIRAEVERLRAKSDEIAGSAVMDRAEILMFLTRIVRARVALLPADSDLWESVKHSKFGTEYRLPDKLGAIGRWADLQSEGSEASANTVWPSLPPCLSAFGSECGLEPQARIG